MKRSGMGILACIIMSALLGTSFAQSDPWVGTFRSDINGETAELQLEKAGSRYQGTLRFMGDSAQLSGTMQNGQLVGQFEAGPGEYVDFVGTASGTTRDILFANGLRLSLSAASPGATTSSGGDSMEISINGVQLTAKDQATLTQLGLQLHPGRYWYDRMNGAWGFFGGPTMGFIAPGLPIETPMPAHASNGNTQVFVNGRNLHMQDWALLSQLVGNQIAPGRYWIDAQGNAGYEGGPAILNLVALSQQRSAGGGGGGGTTWSSLLSSGSTDGQGNGFVQLPNGGFVSHGF